MRTPYIRSAGKNRAPAEKSTKIIPYYGCRRQKWGSGFRIEGRKPDKMSNIIIVLRCEPNGLMADSLDNRICRIR